MQSFIGHAVNIAWAAFRDQPLHHCVDTGSPVGTPHAPTAKTHRARLLWKIHSDCYKKGKSGRAAVAHLVWPLTAVRSPTPTVQHTPVFRSQLTWRLEWYVLGLRTQSQHNLNVEEVTVKHSWRWGEDEYLQRSSSEMEKANNNRPMFMITVLVSGHTWNTSDRHYSQRNKGIFISSFFSLQMETSRWG